MSNHRGPRINQHAAPPPRPQGEGVKQGDRTTRAAEWAAGGAQRPQNKRNGLDSAELLHFKMLHVSSVLCMLCHNLKKKGSRFHFSRGVFLNDENSQTDRKPCPLPSERSYHNTSPLVFRDHRNKCTYWKGSADRPSDPSGWLLQGQHDAVWGRLLRNL